MKNGLLNIGNKEKQPFTSGDLREDLDGWSRKLQALGGVVGAIAWYRNNTKGSNDVFEDCGEWLGYVIEDYAEAIRLTLDENWKFLADSRECIVFSLERCLEIHDFIGKQRNISDICAIDFRIKELDAFIKSAALPAIKLKESFEAIKQEIIENHRKAPETVAAAAGA